MKMLQEFFTKRRQLQWWLRATLTRWPEHVPLIHHNHLYIHHYHHNHPRPHHHHNHRHFNHYCIQQNHSSVLPFNIMGCCWFSKHSSICSNDNVGDDDKKMIKIILWWWWFGTLKWFESMVHKRETFNQRQTWNLFQIQTRFHFVLTASWASFF